MAGSFGMMASSISMITSGITNFMDAAKEGELTFGTIVGSIASVGIAIGMLIPAWNGLTGAVAGTTLA
jgi:hypothetical protein